MPTRAISPILDRITATRALWLLIGLMAALTVVSFAALGLRIDLSGAALPVCLTAAYAAVTFFYVSVRKDATLSLALITTGQLLLVVFLGALMSYAAAAIALPYRDAEFYSIDQWLGFDRKAYLALVSRYRWVEQVLDGAYLSITPQTLLVTGALIFGSQTPRLQAFIMAFGVSLIITVAIAALMPAVAAGEFVDLPASGLTVLPKGYYSHVTTLEALRSGAMTLIPITRIEALVTFPSFHTVNAILFAWALWKLPYVRWFGVALNGLMIASTPTAGSHYFIDIVGGVVVAAIAIWAANRLLPAANQHYELAAAASAQTSLR